jgi:hypothetical protein
VLLAGVLLSIPRVSLASDAEPTPTPAPTEVPRFQVEVARRSPQDLLREQLKDLGALCGPVDHGAPTVQEMSGPRPRPAPAVNFVPLFGVLLKRLKKHPRDEFFVYRVIRSAEVNSASLSADGGRVARGGTQHFMVRKGKMPETQMHPPDVVVELVASFPDRRTAAHAWTRLEQGFNAATPAPERNPCAPH